MSGDFRLLELLSKLGYHEVADYGDYYRTRPLYRESDNNLVLSITKEGGHWYDFKTKQRGSIYDLIALTNPEIAKQIQESGFKLELSSLNYDDESIPEINVDFTLHRNELIRLAPDHSYWAGRGIEKLTVEPFFGGVSKLGKMYGRYVFPIFDLNEKIIGVAGRDLGVTQSKSFRPKWKLIGKKQKWIYPAFLNDSDISHSCYLVESIGDMLALKQAGINNVLVCFGTEVPKAIVLYLLKKNIKKIILSFNKDEGQQINGKEVFIGQESAEEAKVMLSAFFDEKQVIIKHPTRKDFGEMTTEEIFLWQKN